MLKLNRRTEAWLSKAKTNRREPRIRLGMVGGGAGAFIGAVHRMAARLDDQFELVAGALSSTPEGNAVGARPRARSGAHLWLLQGNGNPRGAAEDGIETVSIVTPMSFG